MTTRKAYGRARPDPSPEDGVSTEISQDRAPASFPIVGVGASAGGLEAFTQLLENLPTDMGMAFVLIQHLDPTRESLLAEILNRTTPMPVVEVQEGMEVEPNHVYAIPPNTEMVLVQNRLRLVSRKKTRDRFLPIDTFFQSLARNRDHQAIAIVLSGTDGDGALGLTAIKAAGGITFAQDIDSSRFEGMPHSAISTGCVDFVLPPQAIAAKLTRIGQHPYIASFMPQNAGAALREDGLTQLFALLRAVKGFDFTGYKPATLKRRIMRRMALLNIATLENYLNYLQTTSTEVDELCQDLLINVTSFFRDPEIFEVLKRKIFPSIARAKSSESPIRIWIAGCSTGEEAYSIAICLLEYLGESSTTLPIQIFATDISEATIEKARKGIYKEDSLENVSPERLKQFFAKVKGGYQISKSVRELCVFAKQNLNSDPPFSQLDLISCRNVLIYLGTALQKRLFPIFNYALNSNGFLMLGAAETVGEFSTLFEQVDKKYKIYSRKTASVRLRFDFKTRTPLSDRANPIASPPEEDRTDLALRKEADRLVLNRYAPVGVIIDDAMDILHFRGQTSAYLEPASGKASLNILRMAREGLGLELRTAIQDAKKNNKIARKTGLQIEGRSQLVTVEVIPVKVSATAKSNFLVLFMDEPLVERSQPKLLQSQSRSKRYKAEIDRENLRLKHELESTREYLQSIIEEQDFVNQSLQVANEEVLSSNEELQSTNEELETTQEELQATNEEINTINDELRSRNLELNQINNDLHNLLGSINIPILMLDGNLRIRRFTPLAEGIFNLIGTDLGRRFSDIQSNLAVSNLSSSIETVMDTLTPIEREVQDLDRHWYSLRIRPYRTTDNRIDGVVIGVIDIDALKRSAIQIEAARDYAHAILETVRQPLLVLDENLRVLSANRFFYETFQLLPAQIEQQSIFELENGQWDIAGLRSQLETVLTHNTELENFEIDEIFHPNGPRILSMSARKIQQDNNRNNILLVIEDITAIRQADEKVQHSLREKDILLREIHHRVKNNLQIVSSLLSLQGNRVTDPQTRNMLQSSQNRVKAMALIHETLYQSTNFASVDFAEYAQTLLSQLWQSYAIEREAIALRVELQPGITITLDKAVLCGLILNELVANALKHGFPDGQRGEVVVTLAENAGNCRIVLSVGNNGQPLPPDFDLQNLRAMGLNLVLSLVEQIKGTLEIDRNDTTTFKISFPANA
ncbi:chemotaxis protein CheB [Altericista sp. CCNU0014]|uniref:chemotaxis protein CheB n=1 Tax=Altericista sp. CCNU0014 TaxID=3082949 RepID=UPI00384D89E6